MHAIGRRKDSRLRVGIPARLITLGGEPKANLCDVSQSGARLHCQTALEQGEEGVLIWLGYEAFGRVVWVSGGYAGMEFDELLDKETLFKTREIVDSGLAPKDQDTTQNAARKWYLGIR